MPKLLLFAAIFCVVTANSQSLKKYPIYNSGCSVYMFCDVKGFQLDYSEDSSLVYTGECINSDITYGVICVKLLHPVADRTKAEELMLSYLDFIKADFSVLDSAGYGRGHTLKDYDKAVGVIDYWKDSEARNWKVKAWTDGNYIVVLYGQGKKELPEAKMNVFLDGIRFPGMK